MKYLLIFLLQLLCYAELQSQNIISIKIDGSINPASASFIEAAIKKADDEKARALLIHLNTPGGLLKSTRVIVSGILESKVPVIVFVSPSGGHAGSAGVFITMAAHVAAMAPSTNIGAAHPVSSQGSMDSTMNDKVTNDAVAFIRTIAEKRSRNPEWAEDAVRNSVSIGEEEALRLKVIDIIAANEDDLLSKINGTTVQLNSGAVTINTAGAAVEELEMSFIERLLDFLSDPNVAYILLMIGFYGILFEFYSPGVIAPGVIGAICLILAFYSMHTLPINYAGLALIGLAILLFVLEASIISHGILGIGGVVALALGSMMLIRTEAGTEFLRISTSVIVTVTVLTALFFAVIISLVVRGQKQAPTSGVEALIRETGESVTDIDPTGTVRVRGELWNAESQAGRIAAGSRIRVTGIKNLTLYVHALENESLIKSNLT